MILTKNLTNINSFTLNTQAVNDNQVIANAYVDQINQENEPSRKDLAIDFFDEWNDSAKSNQNNDFNDNKLTNINSITIKNNPTDDNHVSNTKYVDEELNKNTKDRFNQTLQNYLKTSVGNDMYTLTKYDERNITDITEIRNPNTGQMLLQKWILKFLNKSYSAKINTFLKSTTNTSPTAESAASTLPQSVGILCMWRRRVIIMELIMLWFLERELILFIYLRKNFIILDFQHLIKTMNGSISHSNIIRRQFMVYDT